MISMRGIWPLVQIFFLIQTNLLRRIVFLTQSLKIIHLYEVHHYIQCDCCAFPLLGERVENIKSCQMKQRKKIAFHL